MADKQASDTCVFNMRVQVPSPAPAASCRPQNIGWRQQESEPHHTTVGFGFIFINCTSGKLPPQNIGWRQQKSEPYHTMVRFGFIFINCTSGKLPPPNIGWRQQESEPYHTMVGFGFVFINCNSEAFAYRLGFGVIFFTPPLKITSQ